MKDFCFEGYYPMLETKNWEKISSFNNKITLYIENYYNKLDYDNDEMKYIIYIFDKLDSNNIPSFNYDNYIISDFSYIDNLITPGNSYNFEVIQPNSNGSIILNTQGPSYVKYQFYKCNSKTIKFKIENSKGYFDSYDYPIERTITQNKYLNLYYESNETLLHSFESDNEFLFIYNEYNYFSKGNENDIEIISVKEIVENIIILEFNETISKNGRYYFIIAKKDNLNNVNTFSDLCYVAKLMINNDDSIIVKNISFPSGYLNRILINISKLKPTENDIFIISMITDYTYNAQFIKYPNPKEFKIERKEAIEIKMNEEIIFDDDKKLFKFEYINDTDEEQTLYLSFNSREDFDIILYLPESEKIERISYDRWNNDNSFVLTNQGIYYIEFDGRIDSDKSVNTFSIFISGKILDTIDLNQKMYYKNLKIETFSKLNPSLIKVNNLIDDRYVFFTYKILDSYYGATYNNPYTICNDNTEECSYDVKTYKFLKNNNYTIYLSFVSNKNNYEKKYYFPSLYFSLYLKIL